MITRGIDPSKYRVLLETKFGELLRAVRKREDITIEKAPDAVDDLQLMAIRDLAISNLNRESRLLRAALSRMDEGTYGVCLHCDEPISPKRLNAVPWASHCIRCQEAADHGSAESGRQAADDFELLDAA